MWSEGNRSYDPLIVEQVLIPHSYASRQTLLKFREYQLFLQLYMYVSVFTTAGITDIHEISKMPSIVAKRHIIQKL